MWELPDFVDIQGVQYEVIVATLPHGVNTMADHDTRQVIVSRALDPQAQNYVLVFAIARERAAVVSTYR